MICPTCSKETNMTFKAFGGVCPKCVRYVCPPRLTLIDLKGQHHGLWNLQAGRYEETENVNWFKTCSWHLRTQQVRLLSENSDQNVIIYHLEYFGDRACRRVPKYPYFDPTQPVCLYGPCASMVDRNDKTEMTVEKSIYKSWAEERFCPERKISFLI